MVASARMRRSAHPSPALVVSLLVTGAALFFGGSAGTGSLPWIGGAAVIAVAVLIALEGLPTGWIALVPLAALGVWCVLSVIWSDLPDRSWDYANRTFVYTAFAALGLFVWNRTRELALGLAALLGAVVVWSLAGKVLPWLNEDYGRIARLRSPVGIWNQLALLADYALPLALWLAWRRRVLGALLAYGWLVALVLTYSRGGVLVAVLVVAAWIALSRRWVEAGATLVAAGIPAAAVVGLALLLPGVTEDGTAHSTRVRDGAVFGLALLAGAAAAAGLARLPLPRATATLRRGALVAVGCGALLVLVVGIVRAPTLWDEFTSTSVTQLPNTSERFATAGSNHRWVWWEQAWDGWKEQPLVGNGAGSFALTNLRYRTTYLDQATEPHSLALQFVSETGLVGLLLLVAAFGALIAAAGRRREHELALSLLLPALALHGLLEIDWDYLAVAAPAFLAAGSLAGRPGGDRRPSVFAALCAAGVAFALVSSLLLPWLGNRWTDDALGALDRPAHAVTLAKRARAVDPVSIEPLLVQGLAEEARGDQARAAALYERATEIQPRNPEPWLELGRLELDAGCARRALVHLERYVELDPQARPEAGAADKDRALRLVNSGKPRC
jgi:tetratricopeptide (TPR) repeat protein